LNIIPETAKPDLLKIKAWIKRTGRVPDGVEVINGDEKFSYTIKRRMEIMERKKLDLQINSR